MFFCELWYFCNYLPGFPVLPCTFEAQFGFCGKRVNKEDSDFCTLNFF
jgi:hypothetical protein